MLSLIDNEAQRSLQPPIASDGGGYQDWGNVGNRGYDSRVNFNGLGFWWESHPDDPVMILNDERARLAVAGGAGALIGSLTAALSQNRLGNYGSVAIGVLAGAVGALTAAWISTRRV